MTTSSRTENHAPGAVGDVPRKRGVLRRVLVQDALFGESFRAEDHVLSGSSRVERLGHAPLALFALDPSLDGIDEDPK
jgi:hypothetical protein